MLRITDQILKPAQTKSSILCLSLRKIMTNLSLFETMSWGVLGGRSTGGRWIKIHCRNGLYGPEALIAVPAHKILQRNGGSAGEGELLTAALTERRSCLTFNNFRFPQFAFFLVL
ncbi:hypothetical protein RvY_12962 [Ramazzottius varieornatus]|uniref:Uncharacterized protein n=1 Tax=Ramazzottius varieornatus TaxID=947166 RepID=A0A1D1VL90_RAMVA|nr:hypothetical protein RvY_12962 [Ramazzottius varieornatus]